MRDEITTEMWPPEDLQAVAAYEYLSEVLQHAAFESAIEEDVAADPCDLVRIIEQWMASADVVARLKRETYRLAAAYRAATEAFVASNWAPPAFPWERPGVADEGPAAGGRR